MKKIIAIILTLALVLGFTACTAKTSDITGSDDISIVQEAAKIEVTDLTGRTVTFDKYPERIVSLSPSNTEILFELGVGDKVVGVTNYCNYPEQASTIEKIGDFEGANIELIKKVQPDVVFAGGYIQEDLIKSLEELNIPVVSTEALDLKGIYKSIRAIAEVTGTEARADEIISSMESKIKAIEEKTKDKEKPRVFYVVWTDPITTAGNQTFINDIIKTAGAINVGEKVDNWAKYSAEELLSDNPDMLIASNFCTPEAVSADYFKSSEIFNKLDAVKNDKVYLISNDDIFARAAPRVIQAIEELVKLFYGDIL